MIWSNSARFRSAVQPRFSPSRRSSSRSRSFASRAFTSARLFPKTRSIASLAEASRVSSGLTLGAGARERRDSGAWLPRVSRRSKARRNRRAALGSFAPSSTHARSTVPIALSSPSSPTEISRRVELSAPASNTVLTGGSATNRSGSSVTTSPGRWCSGVSSVKSSKRTGAPTRSDRPGTSAVWRSPSRAPRGTTQKARRSP